ncbi:MAG: ribosomal RNA small subunit methyltransferase A [Acidobacteria bacterium]|nr:MAG: ribosomal RNA small subunit methyltransferase A [Acidobacteriota bacterium]REK01376.1 MAG: ribosomal RNA small subunit methyltransferase A [Acidobacteriota bacterium]REK14332.1 MAG: ribosomal RNA small subunit methyltransferase A [Acidobacteriota bacterium]REK45047.1 MAG: ribosomal RNA small subunit methyltransferase A [Acidobacteriota bacterium]
MGNEPQEPRVPFSKRSLGQNFLTDRNYIEKIVSAVDPRAGDHILEIGPGRGALTEGLVASGAKVTAIELDDHLADALEERFLHDSNFEMLRGDILETDLQQISRAENGKLKLAANLPYNISTPILRKLFKQRHLLSEVTVMLQKEVAERLAAAPGDSKRGFLTVLIARGFGIRRLFEVPPNAFRPVPRVDSAVVRLVPILSDPDFPDGKFEMLVSAAFRQKRKTLKNNLDVSDGWVGEQVSLFGGAAELLGGSGIEALARAEALETAEWTRLLTNLIDRHK